MLIQNQLLYEKKHKIVIGSPDKELYCYFDYDERYYDINMEFQHFHNFFEIHILLDDDANHIIEGKIYWINVFDIVCLKPYLLHKSEYPKGSPKRRLIIQFNIPFDDEILQGEFQEVMGIFDAAIPIYRFDQKRKEALINLLNDIYEASKSKSEAGSLMIHSLLLSFLCMIYQYRAANIYVPENLSPTVSKIYSVTSYIHEHYSEDLSLGFLARKFYTSSYYLSHLFKKVTGFTLTNYVQMTRIRNAQQLILFTNGKITDIANKCGFSSFSQFNRVFNRFCGASPRDYKHNNNRSGSDIARLPMTKIRS